ncbi:MAG: F0F1 ATP synthase subunit B [Leptospiraceae bacterium]|nr:F0F1 ATP synthase subunit B [Leptospiraceae bacterium]MDW7977037.1 F0F1 ATP synthase subunit B [Leptospiraceae bacterium]
MKILLAGGIALLEMNPGLVIWTTFTFILVAVLLYIFAWKKIIVALDQRAEYIENNIKQAEKLRIEAEQKFQEYETKLLDLKQEAQEIIQEAKKDAENLKNEIVQKAKVEAEELRRRAQKEINLAKESAIQEIHNYAIELSMEIARKAIHKTLTPEEHRRLLEETLRELKSSQN